MNQIYKFGGASIATPERMLSLLPIVNQAQIPTIVVVSAIGKTTNALEEIVNTAIRQQKNEAHGLASKLEESHINYCNELFENNIPESLKHDLSVCFTELQWAIDDVQEDQYDYSYDQIVCVGELLATKIFHALLCLKEAAAWVDARDIIRTDPTYRDPKIDWEYSQDKASKIIQPLLQTNKFVVTQGFIGATDDNASVTLGREGSDYTAGLLAYFLNAQSVTIWKDVEGLLNADPKLFEQTVKIEAITYHEVIEMAFYGAQVIHPKTIKPLQNKQIPLYVRSFLQPEAKGTIITGEVSSIFYPPLIILKDKQVLIQVTTRDFSFITEDNLSRLYRIFSDLGIKINLIQNAAISFVACIDHDEKKLTQLIDLLQYDFKVFRNENVQILTIRHYNSDIIKDLTRKKFVLLEQKTRQTAQFVIK